MQGRQAFSLNSTIQPTNYLLFFGTGQTRFCQSEKCLLDVI